MLSQSIMFTLSFFSKEVVVLEVCLGSLCWKRVSEERGSCSASDHAERHIQRLSFENRRRSAASIAAEVKGLGGGQPISAHCADHTPHTASNWSAWLSSQKEASSTNDAQESPQTVC